MREILEALLLKKGQQQTEQPRGTTIIPELDRQRNIREGVKQFLNKDIDNKKLDKVYAAESRQAGSSRTILEKAQTES
jgi:hypothetical protein